MKLFGVSLGLLAVFLLGVSVGYGVKVEPRTVHVDAIYALPDAPLSPVFQLGWGGRVYSCQPKVEAVNGRR